MATRAKKVDEGYGTDSKVFVCDLGFSSAKCLYDGKEFRVLSVYQEQGGQSPLIGRDALDSPGGVSHLMNPQHLRRYYPNFLASCLEEGGVNEPVRVAVGLPALYFEEQCKIPGGGDITILRESLMELDLVESVEVLPQGLAGLRHFMKSDSCENKESLVLGVDFGFNTIIYTLWDGKISKRISGETLYKKGISQMVEHYLKRRIMAYTSGFAMTIVEISRLMEQGFIPVGLDRIDLRDDIEAAANEYMDKTIAEILEKVRGDISAIRPIDTIVFFGGGANYLEGKFKSGKIDIVVLPEPEYANARGFLSFMEE